MMYFALKDGGGIYARSARSARVHLKRWYGGRVAALAAAGDQIAQALTTAVPKIRRQIKPTALNGL